ncbi:TcfC E-set like domain-containing protein [Aliikangiella sp. IMCC44359]|uniref:TcfC E-set like domain-containing protein n=1 Tax=Aliikangiella sp. IMCC44359 TaxID=3459125 RepID=UPI00403AE56A
MNIIPKIYAAEPVEKETLSQYSAVVTTTPPPGFEDLLEPQLALVDIFYNDRLVGSSMAQFTTEQIIFESPLEVVNFLANVKEPDILLKLLSVPLAINSVLVCHYQGQPDCGVLIPENIGIIFSEGQLRVDLFINSHLLKAAPLAIDKYLPPSTSGLSMINAFSIIASGGEQREDIYTARVNSLLSYDNYRLFTNLETDDKNGTRLDQLSLTYEYRDMAYQVGSFRTLTQSSGFFEQRDLLGVRVQSSLASRTDLEQVSGTRLFVFLNEHSRVEVYKDGQLIDSRSYQAGNIELDSQNFPQGSYTLEVKIIGDSGKETTESYFYSKSLQLPPISETLFFAELGYPEDDKIESTPVPKSKALGRIGIVTRPTDFMGVNSAIVVNSEQEILEIGSFWFGNQIEFQTNHALNQDEEHAAYYLLGLRHADFFLSASYRRTYSEPLDIIDPSLRLIKPNSRQTAINLGLPFSNSMLNLFARTGEQEGKNNFKNIGLSWRKNIYQSGNILIDWTIDATKENDDKRIMSGLTLRFLNKKYNVNSTIAHNQYETPQSQSNHLDKNARITYRNPDSSIGAVSHSFNVTETEGRLSSLFQSEVGNDYGYGRLILENIKSDPDALNDPTLSTSKTGYSMTSHFNFVTDGGDVALGGDRQNTAGVMINLQFFESDELYFSVFINGVEKTRIKAGDNSFIALPPYDTYRVVLSPVGETLVSFDDTPKIFTLYPGNVESLSWQIEQVKVIVMQLISFQNKEFSNARLQDEELYARTDDMGWVQMEVKSSGELVFINNNGELCKVYISSNELDEMVNYLGVKKCY